jgi:hypothetical protein
MMVAIEKGIRGPYSSAAIGIKLPEAMRQKIRSYLQRDE